MYFENAAALKEISAVIPPLREVGSATDGALLLN